MESGKSSGWRLLVAVTVLVGVLGGGCDEIDCEERCSDRWYEECEECADGPPLFESECADIWCDE